ncbi:MAG: DUF6554 family protein [Synechococcaceae cyanobacterium]
MAPRLAPCLIAPLRAPLLTLLALGGTSLGLLTPTPVPAQAAAGDGPGAKGAQVYCFMRNNGNDHAVSWNAAYALIKRQSASMFRTSPEHAAVMITEAVVNNPGTYPDCGRYLGDLYRRGSNAPTSAESAPSTPAAGRPETGSSMTRSERYNN